MRRLTTLGKVVAVSSLILILVILFFLVRTAHGSTSQITGTLKDSFGNGVSGTLVLQLPVPAVDTSSGASVSPAPITCRLTNGVVSNCPPVFDVANLQPQNLFYIARAYDSSGTLVFNGNYPITGVSYNLFSATPTTVTTSNISYINPASTSSSNTFCCTQTFQGQIVDTLATGTPPLNVTSTTQVPNLNVGTLTGCVITGTPTSGQVPTATSPTACMWQSPSANLSSFPNNAGGTSAGLIVKLTAAPSTVVTVATSDTGGAVGICVSGCGTTGSAQITTVGQASCVFDGATTANDYVQISSGTAGDCHDAGATFPATGQVLGRVLSTNGAGGTYNMTLFGVELSKGATAGLLFQTTASYVTTSITGGTPTVVLSKAVTFPTSGCPCRAQVGYFVQYTVGSQTNTESWVSDGTNVFGIEAAGINAANLLHMGLGTGDISPVTYANGAVITFTVNFESGINNTMESPSFQGSPYLHILVVPSN